MGHGPGMDTVIDGFAQPQLFAAGEAALLGPFASASDALKAIIDLQLRLKITNEVSALPLDNYLANRWKLEMILNLCASLTTNEGQPRFCLKHNDDKGDHLLVDHDARITGIIDWEYTSTEVRKLAFSSPCMMWPVRNFYNGYNNLSAEELEFAGIFQRRGRHDMADIILEGRKWQRSSFP